MESSKKNLQIYYRNIFQVERSYFVREFVLQPPYIDVCVSEKGTLYCVFFGEADLWEFKKNKGGKKWEYKPIYSNFNGTYKLFTSNLLLQIYYFGYIGNVTKINMSLFFRKKTYCDLTKSFQDSRSQYEL